MKFSLTIGNWTIERTPRRKVYDGYMRGGWAMCHRGGWYVQDEPSLMRAIRVAYRLYRSEEG